MLLRLLFVVSSVAYRSISNSNFPVKMPRFCCVYGCSTTASKEKGITVHLIPYFEDTRPVAKQRRKRWIDFVRKHGQNGHHPSIQESVLSISTQAIMNSLWQCRVCYLGSANLSSESW